MSERARALVMKRNWHAIEGPNGRCACGQQPDGTFKDCHDLLVEEVHAARLAVDPHPSGASPQAETSDGDAFFSRLRARWAAETEALKSAPVSPVEPDPPTTCRCLDCEPLTDPGPKPSEDDINRLEKAAWDSKTDRVLVWYRDRAEMFRQRLRETERAWQLDRKKPTVELEPCVWRESGNRLTKAPCFDSPWFGRHAVAAWKVCPYCGAPLKVER